MELPALLQIYTINLNLNRILLMFNILDQSLSYFDSFVVTNALGRLVRLKKKYIQLTLVLTIYLKLLKKQSIPLRKGV